MSGDDSGVRRRRLHRGHWLLIGVAIVLLLGLGYVAVAGGARPSATETRPPGPASSEPSSTAASRLPRVVELGYTYDGGNIFRGVQQ